MNCSSVYTLPKRPERSISGIMASPFSGASITTLAIWLLTFTGAAACIAALKVVPAGSTRTVSTESCSVATTLVNGISIDQRALAIW